MRLDVRLRRLEVGNTPAGRQIIVVADQNTSGNAELRSRGIATTKHDLIVTVRKPDPRPTSITIDGVVYV